MDTQLLSQIALPVILATMMLAMGLTLKLEHFKVIGQQPKPAILGLTLQLFALPAIAWIVIWIYQLPAITAAGLLLLSVAPGGATSNVLSYLSKGNLALSIALTSITSLIAPISIVLLTEINFSLLNFESESFKLPWLQTIMQLLIVTVIPVVTGMLLLKRFPGLVAKLQPTINKVSGSLMILLVIMLAVTSWSNFPSLFSQPSAAVFTLILIAMSTGYFTARLMNCSNSDSRTLLMEVGIQNAGTAMMVAYSLLNKPELAIIPLFYGVAMNLPAFAVITYIQMNKR